jgi:Domain of unknown function (DUF397)
MDLTQAEWHKSSYSGANGGQCVEVAVNLPEIVALRDSKNPSGPALIVEPQAFAALLAGIRVGEFD